MRSVLVHLKDAAEGDVRAWLDAFAMRSSAPQWLYPSGIEPALYIEFWANWKTECEPEAVTTIIETLGDDPAVNLLIDISGRVDGTAEVMWFVTSILTRFTGVALDDYSDHCWTLKELVEGLKFDGHPFFDFKR